MEAHRIKISKITNKYCIYGMIIWSSLIIVSTYIILKTESSASLEAIRIEARSSIQRDIIYRRWNSMNSGVYAPISRHNEPNPYLTDHHRDIELPNGVKMTKINPAYMTRQVHELALKEYGIKSHITSLKPIRKENVPEDWEMEALNSFETGEKEFSVLQKIEGIEYFSFMIPLTVEPSCLSCHASQGYKTGDIRGGISISIPTMQYHEIEQHHKYMMLGGHIVFWLLGMCGLFCATKLLSRQIMQRVELEDALQAAEDRYKEIFNNTTDGIAVYQTVQNGDDFVFVDFNPAAEKISNIKKDKIIKKSVLDVFPAVKDYGIWDALKKVYSTGIPLQLPVAEYKDQRISHWSNNSIFKLSSGEIVAIYNDETKRKTAEIALQSSESRFREMANHINDVFWLFDWKKQKVIYASPAYEKIWGRSVDALIDNYDEWGTSIHPDDRDHAAESFQQLLETGEEKKREYRIIRPDGHVRWIEDNGFLIYDETGELVRITGIAKDITEHQKYAHDLEESRNLLNSLLEAIPDIVYFKDTELRTLYVNQAYEKFLGQPKKEILEKNNFELLPHDLAEQCQKSDETALNQYGSFRTEEKMICKNGHHRYFETTKNAIRNKDNTLVGLVGISRDVTEQKKVEEQLRQTQKMESIGTLAGGIAHDFNNILSPILGYTEMLLEDCPQESDFQESLNEIHVASLRAKELVEQILTFSRQEYKELKLMKIQPIIKEVLKLLRSTIPTTIEIKQDISPDCGVVKADPTQIHQIIINLTTNAHHAMEETGGELKVVLKEVKLDVQDFSNLNLEVGDYACLIIADTGMGMENEVKEKIFEPFFTTKQQTKGTGMGLSVVHGIVKSSKGNIRVYSEPGKGTEFYVYLPLVKKSSDKEARTSKQIIQGGREKLLLVDDEKPIIKLTKGLLERLGYRVTSFTCSMEALKAFRSSPYKFDLVITDMAMPKMAGDKLSAEIKKIRPDIPILLCTGFSEIMSEEKALSLGINAFLMKPVAMKDLAPKIRDVLDKHKK